MGRRYDVWRCEFEKCLAMQHKWCELLEAEAREEKESESKAEEDRPPATRASTPAAFGDVATFAPEKVASRRKVVAEKEGGVVEQGLGRPEVARKLEERSKTFDVAAMAKDLERIDVELPPDASGVGARGDGFAMGTTRPRARGRRVVAAPLDRGQIGGVNKWSSESAVMAEKVFNFVGSKGPEMVRRAVHVGQVFRNMLVFKKT